MNSSLPVRTRLSCIICFLGATSSSSLEYLRTSYVPVLRQWRRRRRLISSSFEKIPCFPLSPLSARHKVQRASVYLNRRPNERTDERAQRHSIFIRKGTLSIAIQACTHRQFGGGAAEGETKFNKRKNEKSWRERGKGSCSNIGRGASEVGTNPRSLSSGRRRTDDATPCM